MSDPSVPECGSSPPRRVLCVDDEQNILSSLRRLFRLQGYQIQTAVSGADGLKLLETEPVDLIVSDMRMPEMDGAQFLEQVRLRWPDTIRILLTGYADIASTVDAINKGEIYRYIAKPWNDDDLLMVVRHALEGKSLKREKERLEALTAAQNEALKDLNANLELKVMERTVALRQSHDKLKTSFLTSIKVFANLIELRGPALAGHSRRVADLARKIATIMNLSAAECQDIFLAGLLHDIGKIGLPDTLLTKAVPNFTGDELGLYRKHPAKGEQALMALAELRGAAEIVRSHHERYDGQGFPEGLSGLAIPIGARILAVANDFDGLQIGTLSMRHLHVDDARKLIAESRGKRYDPAVVDAFLQASGGMALESKGEEQVSPANLHPDMVLARDILSRDGVLLLAADHVLDVSLIRQIREYVGTEGGATPIFIRTQRRSS